MPVSYLRFNQDSTCVVAISETQLGVYNCDPFGLCYSLPLHSTKSTKNVAELLFSTSLLVVGGPNTENETDHSTKLTVLNTKKNTTICSLPIPKIEGSIVGLRMNRSRLLVVLNSSVRLYNISGMQLLQQLEISPSCFDMATASETDPIVALSTNTVQPGTALLFDASNFQSLGSICCHQSPIRTLVLSPKGRLLASASTAGTIIRVFSTVCADGKDTYSAPLCEFRRGSFPTVISSLAFSPDCSILAGLSLTGTLHFFAIPPEIAALESTAAEPTVRASLHADHRADSTAPHGPEATPELPHSSPLTPREAAELHHLTSHTASPKPVNSPQNRAHLNSPTVMPIKWTSAPRSFSSVRLPVSGPSIVTIGENACYVATSTGVLLHYSLPSVNNIGSHLIKKHTMTSS